MDIGGIKSAPAAANQAFANRAEPTETGTRAVMTELPREIAVRAVGYVDRAPSYAAQQEQQSREAMLKTFIKTRNVVDPRTRELVARAVDTRTGEIVQQFPDEVTLKLREYLSRLKDAAERGAPQRYDASA